MKTLLASVSLMLLASVILVHGNPRRGPPPPHVKAGYDVCLKELDITMDELHERRKSGAYKTKDCFGACVDKELGVMTADGTIDKTAAINNFPPHIPKENATRIVETCSAKIGEDKCETSALYHTCVKRMIPRPPMLPEMQKIHDDCKDKLNLSEEDIDKLEHSRDEVKEDCFVACIGKGIGFLNEDGTLNEQVLVEKSPPHVIKEDAAKIAAKCAKQTGANECETAVLLHKCFRENDMIVGHRYGPPPNGPHHH